MMNTKKIAALSLLVIFGVGKVSADPTPFKIDSSNNKVNAILTKIAKTDAFKDKNDGTKKDEGMIKTAFQKLADHHNKDKKAFNEIDLGNKIKSLQNITLTDDELFTVYAYLGRNGGGSGSSSGWGWIIGAGVMGLVIGGAGAYFVLSGDSNGASDE